MKKLPWPTAARGWLDFVPKLGARGRFPRSSRDEHHGSLPNSFNRNVRWVNLPRARGLGVYDVALTWQRSRVRFSPSPPMNIVGMLMEVVFYYPLFKKHSINLHQRRRLLVQEG